MIVSIWYNAAKLIAFEKARKDKKDVHAYNCPPSSVKHFLKLRREMDDDEDESGAMDEDDPIMFLVEHIFGQAHGLRNWRSAKCFQRISQVLTVSDEAFVCCFPSKTRGMPFKKRSKISRMRIMKDIPRGVYMPEESTPTKEQT